MNIKYEYGLSHTLIARTQVRIARRSLSMFQLSIVRLWALATSSDILPETRYGNASGMHNDFPSLLSCALVYI